MALDLMEQSNYADGCLRHFFPPIQRGWVSGEPVFTTEKVIEWTLRAIKAKAAITWAVALADAERHRAPLASTQMEQLKAVNEAVKKWRTTQSHDVAPKK